MSDEFEDDDAAYEIPEGVALFPDIQPSLGVHPLLLSVLNALVFFAASSEDVVSREVSEAMLQRMVDCLSELKDADLRRVKEDMSCLLTLAKSEKWDKADVLFLKTVIQDIGIETTKGDEA